MTHLEGQIVMPRLGGSTHGNRYLPLSEFQILETQPKARKAYDNLAHRRTETQPDLTRLQSLEKYSCSSYSTEILIEFRLKIELPLAQEK